MLVPVAVEANKTYDFDPEKHIRDSDIPVDAAEELSRVNLEYPSDPAAHFGQVISAARPPVRKGGAPYAIFEDEDSSSETALVMPLPYCNPVRPDIAYGRLVAAALRGHQTGAFDSNTWNNGEKHLFLFRVMRALGIRDEAGQTIPVITVGADSQDYRPELDRQGKRELRQGDLGVYVRNIEDILGHTGHGRLHVGGYSQGASVAHQFVSQAGRNFDIASALLAEPPTYKNRSVSALAVNYLLNKPVPGGKTDHRTDIKWTADGPQSRKDLEEIENRAFVTMAQSIVLNGAWRAALGLRHGTMIPDLVSAVDQLGTFPLTVSWNETSSLTHDIEEKLFGPDTTAKAVLDRFRQAGRLRTVKALGDEAVGAPHLAGESPMYYALMVGESVQWANGLS